MSWRPDRDLPTAVLAGRKPAKLLHNIVPSMPGGTSPAKLLSASRNFAREEFALKHRYLMVLHTDQQHPHVHLVVKAVGEDGRRLNIRKATLRGWRRDFAAQLRAQGVAANATERAVRGEVRPPARDGIYRAAERGDLRRGRVRSASFVRHAAGAGAAEERGTATLRETRSKVLEAWGIVSAQMLNAGHPMADEVWGFLGRMPKPRPEQAIAKNISETRLDKERQLKRDEPTR